MDGNLISSSFIWTSGSDDLMYVYEDGVVNESDEEVLI